MTVDPVFGTPSGPAGSARARLRVSATDRDRAIEVLQNAYGDGRLSKDEHDGRVERALSAVTYHDLDRLVADLPSAATLYPAGPTRTNAFAITALTCGIAQFFGFWLLGTVPAVVFGHIARRQIRRTGEQGAGMALAGVILGWVGVALTVLFVLAVVLGAMGFLHLLQAKVPVNPNSGG